MHEKGRKTLMDVNITATKDEVGKSSQEQL